MNARERVLCALAHEEGDSVPLDFGGTPSSGIHVDAYAALTKWLQIDETPVVFDLLQFIALPSDEMKDRMQSDVALLPRYRPRFGIPLSGFTGHTTFWGTACLVPDAFRPVKEQDGGLSVCDQDGHVLAHMPEGGRYFDFRYAPHAALLREESLDGLSFDRMDQEETQFLASAARRLRGEGRAVVGAFGGSILEASQRAFGFEACMEALLLQPDYMTAYFGLLTESYLENLDLYLDAVGEEIDVIQMSDDLGSQDSLLLSPATYREMIKPFHARIYGHVHRKCPHLKVLLHSCGAIYPLLDDLIEAGVDAVNPVQISAAGMEPKLLKSRYGEHLTFWGGGANMQHTVRTRGLSAIRSEAAELMEIFKPGGGFVFAPVHNIQADVSPEKILAIYQAAEERRAYGNAAGRNPNL